MNSPDRRPPDEQLAALLGAAHRDAAPPDRAFLDRLRQKTTEVFQAVPPAHPRNRLMIFSPFRWLAAAAATILVLTVVVAHFFVQPKKPDDKTDRADKFVMSDKLIEDGRIGKVTDAQGIGSIR